MLYHILDRRGSEPRLIEAVGHDHDPTAFLMAMRALSRAYQRAGITPAMFDAVPPFEAVPVSV